MTEQTTSLRPSRAPMTNEQKAANRATDGPTRWYAVEEYGGLNSGFVFRFRPERHETVDAASDPARALSRDTPAHTFYVVAMGGEHMPPVASYRNGEVR
jgi:hypothetical protein